MLFYRAKDACKYVVMEKRQKVLRTWYVEEIKTWGNGMPAPGLHRLSLHLLVFVDR